MTTSKAGERVVSARLIEPGSVLADRYLVEDMLVEEGHAGSWRAFDRVLARSVVLQVLPSSSPYAAPLLAAAKQASRVTDPRILQVLDAVDDGELTYVVREWVAGQALPLVLAEGPLPARRAAWLLREIADAMAAAHALGVPHRHLLPENVVLTKASGVKILGLATTAALNDDDNATDDFEHDDTVALGRILYACLTARWPGPELASLPTAPQIHGEYLRPRQVRAGVPRALDQMCDRIVSRSSRYGPPITTAAEIRDALTHALAVDRSTSTTNGMQVPEPASGSTASAGGDHPALLRRDVNDPTPAASGATAPPHRRLRPPMTLIWTMLALLVVGSMLLAYLLGQRHVSDPAPTGTTTSPSPSTTEQALRPIAIAGVTSFDPLPQGSGDENPDLAPLAIDGDPATAWVTQDYYNNPELGGQKDGVGLVLDLGRPSVVSKVAVTLAGAGTSVELRAAPVSATAAPEQSAGQYRLVETIDNASHTAVLSLKRPVTTRYLLVWLTSLPPVTAGTYRGGVDELRVLGE